MQGWAAQDERWQLARRFLAESVFGDRTGADLLDGTGPIESSVLDRIVTEDAEDIAGSDDVRQQMAGMTGEQLLDVDMNQWVALMREEFRT